MKNNNLLTKLDGKTTKKLIQGGMNKEQILKLDNYLKSNPTPNKFIKQFADNLNKIEAAQQWLTKPSWLYELHISFSATVKIPEIK